MIYFIKKGFQTTARGFGLIELLVSVSIMVLVTGIVLANHNAFNGSVLLKSQAYEIALRLREVQLSAVGVDSAAGTVRTQYGARFRNSVAENFRYDVFETPAPAPQNSTWVTGAGKYTLVGAPGLLDQRFAVRGVTLNRRVKGPLEAVDVSILFRRPNYDAEFRNGATGRLFADNDEIESISIRIGPRGAPSTATDQERRIIVTKAGQISVE